MKWFQNNFKKIIYTAFLIPIFLVAVVSISHVTQWYGISNPMNWSVYLSVGIEIAALSALAAIAAKMGKKVYFPFFIVTLIQFLGNIYFAYSYIDLDSKTFKDWVDMVDPIVSLMGVESGDMTGHKRFLALFAGGLLPLISLSFLHMLIKFEEEDREKELVAKKDKETNTDIEKKESTPIEESEMSSEKRKQILVDLMQKDQELGLYDPPFDNPLVSEQTEQFVDEVKEKEIPSEGEKKVEEFDIDEISKETERLEVQLIGEAFVPSEEFLEQLDQELKKIEESKMNILVEELPPQKTKKVLSYTRRDV